MAEIKKVITKEIPVEEVDKIDDRQSVLAFVKKVADENAKAYVEEKKLSREKEQFETYGGGVSSFYDRKLENDKILSEIPKDHEPKFAEFFKALGDLENW